MFWGISSEIWYTSYPLDKQTVITNACIHLYENACYTYYIDTIIKLDNSWIFMFKMSKTGTFPFLRISIVYYSKGIRPVKFNSESNISYLCKKIYYII